MNSIHGILTPGGYGHIIKMRRIRIAGRVKRPIQDIIAYILAAASECA